MEKPDAPGRLPGPGMEFTQTTDALGMISEGPASQVVEENGVRQKPVLVFFIGGVTFAEISALRFVSSQVNRDIIIGTTKLISGSSMLDTLMAAPIRPTPAEQEGTVG